MHPGLAWRPAVAGHLPWLAVTDSTPLSDKAVELQQRIARLTDQLAETDENDTDGRRAIIEQIEILNAELADELPPQTEPPR